MVIYLQEYEKRKKMYAIANAMQDDCYARKSIFFHFATDFLAR